MPAFIPHIALTELDDFETAYLDAALWTSEPDTCDQTELDAWYDSEMSEDAVDQVKADCAAFRASLGVMLAIEHGCTRSTYSGAVQAGHDLWLTRNGHGCGFWDGDWCDSRGDDKLGDQLSERAKRLGEIYMYLGDDGLLYFG